MGRGHWAIMGRQGQARRPEEEEMRSEDLEQNSG